MTPTKAPTVAVFVLWFRKPAQHWREVFRGTEQECAKEFSKLVDAGWSGDFYTAPEGRRP